MLSTTLDVFAQRRANILHVASQIRTCQQVELVRPTGRGGAAPPTS